MKPQSDRFIADACMVMRRSARHALLLSDLQEILAAHNVNCCDGEDGYFGVNFDEYRTDIQVLDEEEFFNDYILE